MPRNRQSGTSQTRLAATGRGRRGAQRQEPRATRAAARPPRGVRRPRRHQERRGHVGEQQRRAGRGQRRPPAGRAAAGRTAGPARSRAPTPADAVTNANRPRPPERAREPSPEVEPGQRGRRGRPPPGRARRPGRRAGGPPASAPSRPAARPCRRGDVAASGQPLEQDRRGCCWNPRPASRDSPAMKNGSNPHDVPCSRRNRLPRAPWYRWIAWSTTITGRSGSQIAPTDGNSRTAWTTCTASTPARRIPAQRRPAVIGAPAASGADCMSEIPKRNPNDRGAGAGPSPS